MEEDARPKDHLPRLANLLPGPTPTGGTAGSGGSRRARGGRMMCLQSSPMALVAESRRFLIVARL